MEIISYQIQPQSAAKRKRYNPAIQNGYYSVKPSTLK